VTGNEPGFSHDGGIPAVAGPAGLALEHVEVVALVVAVFEAVSAEGHALRDAARAAPEGHKVRRPDKATHGSIVVATNWKIKQQAFKLQFEPFLSSLPIHHTSSITL